jgi:hypothetical protein
MTQNQDFPSPRYLGCNIRNQLTSAMILSPRRARRKTAHLDFPKLRALRGKSGLRLGALFICGNLWLAS